MIGIRRSADGCTVGLEYVALLLDALKLQERVPLAVSSMYAKDLRLAPAFDANAPVRLLKPLVPISCCCSQPSPLPVMSGLYDCQQAEA